MTSSCANHAIQLRYLVMQFIEQEDRFPPDGDTRSALAKMSTEGQWPAGWLSSYGSSCPESYLRDGSIGYVFVADGLLTKVVAEDLALVLFCPSGNHQRSEQHCHAVVGRGELICLKSNTEMIELLRREIARARDGSVTYSTNAMSKMARELKAREERERMREPNRVGGRIDVPPHTPPDMRVRVRRFQAVPEDEAALLLCRANSRLELHRSVSLPVSVRLRVYCLPSSTLPES